MIVYFSLVIQRFKSFQLSVSLLWSELRQAKLLPDLRQLAIALNHAYHYHQRA
ncbi:hypothetical protein [Okeania sp. KiyG1]|uniref:hypothetical protein n=1 Tax=Okeania sp. KiyG1 TaxID=2720165 RepID=UPI0019249A74|nr:hypothetical protein [Okeania sp. KiyG1]